MADFAFNAAAGLRPQNTFRYSNIELSEVSLSRAPSHASTIKSSIFHPDDDKEYLVKHARSTSRFIEEDITVTPVLSNTDGTRASRERKRKLQGWRFGVALACVTASSVLLVNLILTIVWASKYLTWADKGIGTIYDGNCHVVDSWATCGAIVINILSSLLLSASNYTMQTLCSPTRAEIDKAHARGDWVDIGVASFRNIFGRISWKRTVIWWLLALSSIPLHLMYNSVIFKTLDSNVYMALVVNKDFLEGKPFSTNITIYPEDRWSNNTRGFSAGGFNYKQLREVQQDFAKNSAYTNSSLVQNLTNAECMRAYDTTFLTQRSNVLLVTSAEGNAPNHTLFYASLRDMSTGTYLSYEWICEGMARKYGGGDFIAWENLCNVGKALQNSEDWKINGHNIDYCLSQVEQPRCRLQFSIGLLLTVVLMNACKAGSMFWAFWSCKDPTLVTTGDAIASFLNQPEDLTKGRCLMAKSDVGGGPLQWSGSTKPPLSLPQLQKLDRRRPSGWIAISRSYASSAFTAIKNRSSNLSTSSKTPNSQPLPQAFYGSGHRRWFVAASIKRWVVALSLCAAVMITAISLLSVGVKLVQRSTSNGSAFSQGFGSVDPATLLDPGLPQGKSGGLIFAVLLANLPQALFSFIYLTFNGLFTSMLMASEWSRYYLRPKALRVTTPRGKQRSTHYLHLPFSYSIPLLACSASIHYLISESIFLVRIDVWGFSRTKPELTESLLGFSCLPILIAILAGVVLVSGATGMGFRKFHSSMPVVGSCSVAISAACHRPKDDIDAAYLPVSWGEIKSEDDGPVSHCAFTSFEVDALTPGRMYAGESPAHRTEHRRICM